MSRPGFCGLSFCSDPSTLAVVVDLEAAPAPGEPLPEVRCFCVRHTLAFNDSAECRRVQSNLVSEDHDRPKPEHVLVAALSDFRDRLEAEWRTEQEQKLRKEGT